MTQRLHSCSASACFRLRSTFARLFKRYHLAAESTLHRPLLRTEFASYPIAPGAIGTPDWQGVVELADQALYRVKEHGRNGWSGIVDVREPLP